MRVEEENTKVLLFFNRILASVPNIRSPADNFLWYTRIKAPAGSMPDHYEVVKDSKEF